MSILQACCCVVHLASRLSSMSGSSTLGHFMGSLLHESFLSIQWIALFWPDRAGHVRAEPARLLIRPAPASSDLGWHASGSGCFRMRLTAARMAVHMLKQSWQLLKTGCQSCLAVSSAYRGAAGSRGLRTYGDIVADDGGLRPVLCIVLGHMDDHVVKHVGVAANLDAVDVPCRQPGWSSAAGSPEILSLWLQAWCCSKVVTRQQMLL